MYFWDNPLNFGPTLCTTNTCQMHQSPRPRLPEPCLGWPNTNISPRVRQVSTYASPAHAGGQL